MSDKEIKVPNIGEFKDVEVIEVLVSNGQSISENEAIITIESDKSSVEIPSSLTGKVKSVNLKVGDKVSEGDTILILEKSEEGNKNIRVQPKIEKEIESKKKKFNDDIEKELDNMEKEELNLKKFNNILMYSPHWRKKSEDGEIPFKMNHFDFFNSKHICV